MTQTRTVYRLMIQDVNLGNLLDEPRGPDCAAPELAKAAELRLRDGEEQLVVAQVDQRKGGDGCWHDAATTIVEVL